MDFAMEIAFEPEEEEGIHTTANWSLRDLLGKDHHNEKPLATVITTV